MLPNLQAKITAYVSDSNRASSCLVSYAIVIIHLPSLYLICQFQSFSEFGFGYRIFFIATASRRAGVALGRTTMNV